MNLPPLRLRAVAFAVGISLLAFAAGARADPPSRVARLGYTSGVVSLSLAGESDWIQAGINRPLTTGDRIWAEPGARAELQVGGAMVRLNAGTAVSVLNLDDGIVQLQLTQGTLNVRVRRLEPGQVFEVDTPNLAFTLRQPGAYRIDVDAEADATTITVRNGQGEVVAADQSFTIDARQPYRFTGDGLREYGAVELPRADDFDLWSSARDRADDNSASARYVSRDVVGYQDLDANGSWRVDPNYGNVWSPSRVSAGWSPYSEGHWAWVDPWGWTWVDDAPWGFAVSHYGRWQNFGGSWGWVPGPVSTRAYYAPALVVFVGGDNFRLTLSAGDAGGVAWFPLAPREVYRPSYPVTRSYFENLNRSNTVVNTTIINNTYNNTNVNQFVFANRQVPGAVIAVPKTAFVQSQPVSRIAVRPQRDAAVGQPLAFAPPIAPTERSVRGTEPRREQPPARAFEKPVVVRTPPPAARPAFAVQLPHLAAQPGRPLDESTRKQIAPAASVPAPAVRVAAPREGAPRLLPAPGAVRAPVAPAPGVLAAVPPPPAPRAASAAPKAKIEPAPAPGVRSAAPPQPTPRAAPAAPKAKAEAASVPAERSAARPQPAPRVAPVTPGAKIEPAPVARPTESRQPTPRVAPAPPAAKTEAAPLPAERAAARPQPAQRVAPVPPPASAVQKAEPRAPAGAVPAVREQAPKGTRAPASHPTPGKPDEPKRGEDSQDGKKPRDRNPG